MTISKAVKIFCEFCSENEEVSFISLEKMSEDFDKFCKKKRFSSSKKAEFFYKFQVASAKDFIDLDDHAKTYGDILIVNPELSDYELDREHKRWNFIYGLIGTAIGCGATLLGVILKTFF